MVEASCDDETFRRLFTTLGASGTAQHLGVSVRCVFERRRNYERLHGAVLQSPNDKALVQEHPQRAALKIKDGIVIVGSDAHYWPGPPTTAHLAFVKLCKELQPAAVIMNGDAFDGASISRHPPIGWENRPTVKRELEGVQERLGEIEQAAGRARKIWPLGNHDARFETRLATVAPEYAEVQGVHLRDHLPLWESCWSCWINDDQPDRGVVVKHRFKGGIHATHNNTMWAGRTVVTGHLHSLKVTPFTDYNGDRWGVDTGCLAEPYGSQFVDYTEDSPRNWRSGFVVLTFVDGRLMWPDVAHVFAPGRVWFQGKVIEVGSCGERSPSPARASAASQNRAASPTSIRSARRTRKETTRSTGRSRTRKRNSG